MMSVLCMLNLFHVWARVQLGAGPNFPASVGTKATAMHFAARGVEHHLSAEPVVKASVVAAVQMLQLLALHGGRPDLTDASGVSVHDLVVKVSPLATPHLSGKDLEGSSTLQAFIAACVEQYKGHVPLTIVDEKGDPLPMCPRDEWTGGRWAGVGGGGGRRENKWSLLFAMYCWRGCLVAWQV